MNWEGREAGPRRLRMSGALRTSRHHHRRGEDSGPHPIPTARHTGRFGVGNAASVQAGARRPFALTNGVGEPTLVEGPPLVGVLLKSPNNRIWQFSETDFTGDLKKIDVPTLIIPGRR